MRRSLPLLAALIALVLIVGCGTPSRPATTTEPSSSFPGDMGHAYKTPYGPSANPPGWGYPPACEAGKSCVVAPPRTASLHGTLRMFDTVTLSSLPSDPFALAGYTSGYWPTFLPLRKRYPQAHTISIAVTATHHADCLDVEPGDATPAQAPGWVKADRKAGWKRPCVYSSYWEFTSQVRPLLIRAGIKRAQVYEIDADYLGCPRLDASFDATQCTDHAYGRNLDESVVTPGFLSLAQPPYTPHAKRIAVLKARIALNQRREERQACGHTVKPSKVHRVRCQIERNRVTELTAQIKRLERS